MALAIAFCSASVSCRSFCRVRRPRDYARLAFAYDDRFIVLSEDINLLFPSASICTSISDLKVGPANFGVPHSVEEAPGPIFERLMMWLETS